MDDVNDVPVEPEPQREQEHGMRCLCEICECGRHKCPRDAGTCKPRDDKRTTEYKDRYPGWDASHRRVPIKPVPNPNCTDAPISNETTFRASYPPHLARKDIKKPPDSYSPPTEPLSSGTNYRSEYNMKGFAKRDSMKPIYKFAKSEHVPGNSIYKGDYRIFCPDEVARAKPTKEIRPNLIHMSEVPMEKSTIQKSDYTYQYQPKRAMCVPPQTDWGQQKPFQKLTEYNATYLKHQVEKTKSIRRDEYKGPKGDMDFGTITKRDYVAHCGHEKVASMGPNRTYNPSTAPLENSTTTGSSYIHHCGTEKPKYPWWAKYSYQPPSEEMEKLTIHKEHYTRKGCCKRTSMKPDYVYQYRTTDPGKSIYKVDYPHYPCYPRPENFRPEKKYEKPTEEMLLNTEFKDRYKGEAGEKRDLIRPCHKVADGDTDFPHDTTYNVDYPWKKATICPNTQIPLIPVAMRKPGVKSDTIRGTFKVVGEKNGHLFYTQVAEPIQA